MTWINQEGREGPAKAPQSVPAPLRHDGVGDALRIAYLARASDLPDDFVGLLHRMR